MLLFAINSSCSKNSDPIIQPPTETLYFPPINSDAWETIAIEDLDWNADQLEPLLDFLEEKNSKSFMIIYNGKIVVEHYMNSHSSTAKWYWASAGKTLTTAVTGIAQHEGLVNLNYKVSDYLGTGWTSAPIDKENMIVCKNLLAMNSGLDDSTGDDVSSSNLHYKADAGTRWAYHNVYVKMQDVIALASKQNWKEYFNLKLRDKIGMSGNWIDLNNLSVYWSDTRSMARFGLLMAAKGKWEDTQIIPINYLNEAFTTSQNSNEAYGYLWWLNGKSTYHLPQSQIQFSGSLIPSAPSDKYAALGKNDQKIYVIPSRNMVIVRMGEAGDGANFAISTFDDDLWVKINTLIN